MLICDFISTCTILLVGYMVHMLILETSTVERMDNARTYLERGKLSNNSDIDFAHGYIQIQNGIGRL
jgi:hypothetical protein